MSTKPKSNNIHVDWKVLLADDPFRYQVINLGSIFQVLGNWLAAAAVWIDAAGFIGSVLGIEAIGWFEDTEGSTDATVLFGVSIPRKDEVATTHSQPRAKLALLLLGMALCLLELRRLRRVVPGYR